MLKSIRKQATGIHSYRPKGVSPSWYSSTKVPLADTVRLSREIAFGS